MHRVLIGCVLAGCSLPSATFRGVDDAALDTRVDDAAVDMADAGNCGNARLDLGEDCDGDAGCSASCTIPPPSNAAVIRFVATVTIIDDAVNAFTPALAIGDRAWGRFVYPFSLADSNAATDRADYVFTNPTPDQTGVFVTLATWTFHPATGNGSVVIIDGAPDVVFAATGNLAVTPQLIALQDVTLQLNDTAGATVTGDGLPRAPFPPFAAWSSAEIRFRGDNGTERWAITATLDSSSFEQAP